MVSEGAVAVEMAVLWLLDGAYGIPWIGLASLF